MTKETRIQEARRIFIPYGNTDNTEGRGSEYTLGFCLLASTATRIAKGKGVMGTDAGVDEKFAYKIENTWYAPVIFAQPTPEDEKIEKLREIEYTIKQNKIKVLKKAKDLGLSEEEIKILNQ